MSSGGAPTASAQAALAAAPIPARRHTVAGGDSAWTIARRHGIGVADLLRRNGLATNDVLRPGMVLQIDPPIPVSPQVAE